MNRELLGHRAHILKAPAHPTRLALVEARGMGEVCVCELQQIAGGDILHSFQAPRPPESGRPGSRSQGCLHVHYRLQVPCLMSFFGCVDAVIQHSADTQSRIAALVR